MMPEPFIARIARPDSFVFFVGYAHTFVSFVGHERSPFVFFVSASSLL
jgi:hypothetical protein